MKNAVLLAKAALTLVFLAAGGAKLIGAEPMVATFDAIGWGQWFRYVTGVIEVGAVVLLWIRGREAIGAGLLTGTMIAAVAFHVLVLGPSAIPATVLGVLSALILYLNRDQLRPMTA